ncbi:hypothetical protein FACS189423_09250 [Bacteroidia bacterium]|nr:hypothetical protein FACS189423_09250 [Bacteroidia bacterium]
MLTVFTPTYNRAYTLTTLYESLIRQDFQDFEWLIVDDGSTDDTADLVESFERTNFPIRYYRQENQGKHVAINKGVQLAKGELFFIVDSDDHVPPDALAKIWHWYETIKDNPDFAGVSGWRCYPDGSCMGNNTEYKFLDCNALDFRYKYKYTGDQAEAYKTDVLKQYPFPEIKGEKFCTEMLVFNRIAPHYVLRYFGEDVYRCEYLPDGLTHASRRIRMDSPLLTTMAYAELAVSQIPVYYKFRAAVNYYRFAFLVNKQDKNKTKISKRLSIFALPIASVFYLWDTYCYRKEQRQKNKNHE